jgi:hypothetical protein
MHAKAKKTSGIGTGGKGKAILMGMRQREGEARAKVTAGTESATLHPEIQTAVAPGPTIYTDEHRGYNGLLGYIPTPVKHSGNVFVDGDAHTNGIESS